MISLNYTNISKYPDYFNKYYINVIKPNKPVNAGTMQSHDATNL